jgi:hypothetical protein
MVHEILEGSKAGVRARCVNTAEQNNYLTFSCKHVGQPVAHLKHDKPRVHAPSSPIFLGKVLVLNLSCPTLKQNQNHEHCMIQPHFGRQLDI